MADKETLLKRHFGHEAFRPGQEKLIDALLSGRDALGIMPTGGGKSLCYQIPGMLLPGITLVISPLISLMKDQVAQLREAGVPAAFLNSSLSSGQQALALSRARQGRYKIIYVAPERLDSCEFSELALARDISLLAVDEAHCVSQWGQDFRPSYLKIRDFVAALPRRPVIAALTATATARVREDMAGLLGLDKPLEVVTGFDRPNLRFEVREPREKTEALLALVAQRPEKSGIVYCATRANVKKVCDALTSRGIPATRYHAGLSAEERRINQEAFQHDRKAVMVATNAFGMGIDKSNISFVIHYNMPKSIEAYYQEAGRAGRDGEAADCVLLYAKRDVTTAKFLISQNGSNADLSPLEQEKVRQRDCERLDAMVRLCTGAGCIRRYILSYFGQELENDCGNCGNCQTRFKLADITAPAQLIFSCILAARQHLGYGVGQALITRALLGSRDKRLPQMGLDRLPQFGGLKNLGRQRLNTALDYLLAQGYIRRKGLYGPLALNPRAQAVLRQGEKVKIPVKTEAVSKPRATPGPQAQQEEPLFEALKATRLRLAREEGVPAYVVFSNASLRDMARRAPRSLVAFRRVSGVGEIKAARYGEAFLRAIQAFTQTNSP